MYGLISGTGGSRRIAAFFRLIGWVSLGVSMVGIFMFVNGLRSGDELIWDRVALAVISLLSIGVSYYKGSKKLFGYSIIVLCYVMTTHTTWMVWMSHAHLYYVIFAFIIIHLYTVAFRAWRYAIFFLIIQYSILFVSVFTRFSGSKSDLIFITILGTFCMFLSGIFSHNKNHSIENLKLQRGFLKSLLNRSETGVLLTDVNGHILDMNDRILEMLGMRKEELLGKDFSFLRQRELTEAEIEYGLDAVRNNRFWSDEATLIRKDGTTMLAYLSITSVDGFRSRFLVYRVRDITEKKKFELDLIRAREQAEDALRTKAKFVATMSHELRTPLNGVIGTSSLLERTPLNIEQQAYVSTIINSSQSLLVLINDILDYSKIESGKMELSPVQCELRQEVHAVADLLRPHAESKQLRFSVNVAYDIPDSILIDSMRLKQVLLNLIGNAVKFTDRGTIDVNVELESLNRDELAIRFRVADTGLGISRSKQAILFRSFTQVDSSINRRFGGSGLGLAISKELVELMGGYIKVESEEGIGSVFQFTVKAQVAHKEKEKEIVRTLADVQHELSVDPGSLRVLIAEDNRINSDVMMFMLQKLGLKASRAFNGNDVIDNMERNEYDIILMDIQMPGMDGLQTTQYIRRNLTSQPYIIAITANASEDDRRSCVQAGMNAFLSKPFLIQDLEQVLVRYFSEAGTGYLLNRTA